ncbi:hypothetical protein LguiA_005917 [Lonicera macranthoides]
MLTYVFLNLPQSFNGDKNTIFRCNLGATLILQERFGPPPILIVFMLFRPSSRLYPLLLRYLLMLPLKGFENISIICLTEIERARR